MQAPKFIGREELIIRLLASRQPEKPKTPKKSPEKPSKKKKVSWQAEGDKKAVVTPKNLIQTATAQVEDIPQAPVIEKIKKKPWGNHKRKPHESYGRTPGACLADTMFCAKWTDGCCLVPRFRRSYNLKAKNRGLPQLTERQLRAELAKIGCRVPDECHTIGGKLGQVIFLTVAARRWMKIMGVA